MLYFQDFWHHEHFSLMLKQTNPELNLYLDTGEQISKQDTVTPFPAQDGEDLNKPEVVREVIPSAQTTPAASNVLDIIVEEIHVIIISQPITPEGVKPEEVKSAEEKATEIEKTEEMKTEEVEKTTVRETEFTQSILSDVKHRISESEAPKSNPQK